MLNWLFGKSSADPAAAFRVESWSVAVGEKEGKELLLRYNNGARALRGYPDYSTRLGVATPLLEQTLRGLPTDEEQRELDELEDFLIEQLAAGLLALNVAVVTTGNMREWIFYTRDPQAAAKVLAHARQRYPHRTLQSYTTSDPRWDGYRSMRP